MTSKILKFLTLAAALCGATAWGATHTVESQEALAELLNPPAEGESAKLVNGDEINLASGTYYMNGMTGAKGKTLTIKGAAKDSTTLVYGTTD